MKKPMNKGEWVDDTLTSIWTFCSNCHSSAFTHYNYCPWCGSRNRDHGNDIEVIPCIIEVVDPIRTTLVLEVEKTTDRPNNPDLDDIVATYIRYHYGEDTEYYYQEGESDYIGQNWNIENYR